MLMHGRPLATAAAIALGLVLVATAAAVPVGDAFDVAGSVEPAVTAPGGSLTVETTVNATGFNAPVMDVELPWNWGVESHADDGGSYRPGEHQWIWFRTGTYTTRLTVAIPEDAPPGDYLVLAQGAAIDGATGERRVRNLTHEVTVNGSADLTAGFDYSPDDPATQRNVSFQATASSQAGEIVAYRWRFGDGANATGRTVTHAYDRRDEYIATLVVEDSTGATRAVQRRVSVAGQGSTQAPIGQPTARFAYAPSRPAANQSVTFNASASTDAEGAVVGYEWDFDGDGTVDAEGSVVTHRFEEQGERNVTLRVTDASGATDTTERPVVVGPAEGEGGPPLVPIVLAAVVLAVLASAAYLFRRDE